LHSTNILQTKSFVGCAVAENCEKNKCNVQRADILSKFFNVFSVRGLLTPIRNSVTGLRCVLCPRRLEGSHVCQDPPLAPPLSNHGYAIASIT